MYYVWLVTVDTSNKPAYLFSLSLLLQETVTGYKLQLSVHALLLLSNRRKALVTEKDIKHGSRSKISVCAYYDEEERTVEESS